MTAADLSAPPAQPAPAGAAPRALIVTGPRGAGKTRLLQRAWTLLRAHEPAARATIVLAEEGRTRMENFVRDRDGLALQKFFPPCLCCPALIDLPGSLTRAVAAHAAGWLFLELPAIAAPVLLPEFDRTLGWPRALVVRPGPRWSAQSAFIPFQAGLLALADETVAPAGGPDAALARAFARLTPAPLSRS